MQPLAERLLVGGLLEVVVAAGAVGPVGDIEVAGVGREVQDLGAGEQARVGRQRDGGFAGTCRGSRRAARSSAAARRSRLAWSVAGVISMSRVTTSIPDKDGGVAADHNAPHLMPSEHLEDRWGIERGAFRRHGWRAGWWRARVRGAAPASALGLRRPRRSAPGRPATRRSPRRPRRAGLASRRVAGRHNPGCRAARARRQLGPVRLDREPGRACRSPALHGEAMGLPPTATIAAPRRSRSPARGTIVTLPVTGSNGEPCSTSASSLISTYWTPARSTACRTPRRQRAQARVPAVCARAARSGWASRSSRCSCSVGVSASAAATCSS